MHSGFKLNHVLDGGFGMEIQRRGLPFKRPQWSALLIEEQPSAIADIHSDYIHKGSNIITTNTYAIMPLHIGEQKFREKGHEMITVACEMAKKARDLNPDKNVQIAFSVPPLESYTPQGFLADIQKAKGTYEHYLKPVSQIEYIDFYLCETLSTIEEAKYLMGQMQKLPKPYCLSFCVNRDNGDLWVKGETWEKLVQIIKSVEKKPIAVMINCSPAEVISKNVKQLRRVLPKDISVGCYPNNFSWIQGEKYNANNDLGTFRSEMTPQVYEKLSKEWIQLGAQIIGGCCQIGPEYIPSISKAFEETK